MKISHSIGDFRLLNEYNYRTSAYNGQFSLDYVLSMVDFRSNETDHVQITYPTKVPVLFIFRSIYYIIYLQ